MFPAAFLLICVVVFGGVGSGYAKADNGYRADIIELALPASPAGNRMPPALFLHDAHTEALKTGGCGTCHPKTGDRFVFSFKQTTSPAHGAKMALYHDQCIGCHKQMAAQGKHTGPRAGECRLCHRKKPQVRSDRRAIDFNRSLHFRHVSAEAVKYRGNSGKNCGACHHVGEAEPENNADGKQTGAACQYCHKAHRTDDVRSYRNAAHLVCVNCHEALRIKGIEAGPVDCSGCHSPAGQRKIRIIKDAPCIERGQPEAVLMAPWLSDAIRSGKLPEQMIPPVAFNHRLHESETSSCRDCHHASLAPCGTCHTPTGNKQGGDVPLATAMHAPDSDMSCVGCHDAETRRPDCAGCHDQMPKKRFDQRDCRGCHSVSTDALHPLLADAPAEGAIAKDVVTARDHEMRMVETDRIPEFVNINILSDQYQAVAFPHRQMVVDIADRIKDSRLAAVFHDAPTTLCQGCHHHSPPSLTPPRCVSCHRLAADAVAEDRPDLKGAYHDQCMTCHQKMGIKKPAATDCTACHRKKAGKKF